MSGGDGGVLVSLGCTPRGSSTSATVQLGNTSSLTRYGWRCGRS